MFDSQSKMYNTEQSKAQRRIITLEAECAYLKNEIAQQIELTGVTTRLGRQPNECDQILYSNLPWVNTPRNLHGYQFHDAAATRTPYSTSSSESPDSSDSESYGSPMANHRFDYHDHPSSIIRPRSICLSQNHRSQLTSTCLSCTSCNWSRQQDNVSLSQSTDDEYDIQTDMTRYSGPHSLSQEHNPFHESTTYSSWNSMPSYGPTSKELKRNTNSLSFYRSSSCHGSSRVELSQTMCVSKQVVTSHGVSNVKCEEINRMSELYLGKRIIVYRYYQNINEFGTVRKLNVIINRKPRYVGVELDLPS